MRRGDDGFFGGTARTPDAVKGAEDRVGSGTGLGGLREGLTGTVVDFVRVPEILTQGFPEILAHRVPESLAGLS